MLKCRIEGGWFTEEGSLSCDGTGFFVCEKLLVPFVGCEAYCHFGDYPCDHSSEALVQT